MSIVFTPLVTDQFQLRPIVDSDINKVYEGLSHPEVIKYYGVNYDSLAATLEQMKWFEEILTQGVGIWLAITSPDGDTFFGAVGLNNLSQTHQKAEIGFWLLPAYWGRGLMTAAVKLLCNFAFSNLGLHRIEAFVETPNQDSKNLLAKLNFEHEGTMVDSELKNGNFISIDIYAKLAATSIPSR